MTNDAVIIHPTDYVVIAVIGGEGRVGSRSGGRIILASDDRVFVRRHVDLGARVRLGIGSISIGMNFPDSVELRPCLMLSCSGIRTCAATVTSCTKRIS